jgi:mannose-6-phosphate isomerase-like protein (cupin superfamily)
MKEASFMPTPLVHYQDETESNECPYGNVQRIVTGGEGGIANVHVVHVTRGESHYHSGYDEVYYVLSGTGTLLIGDTPYSLRPGAVAVIPAGLPHSLVSNTDAPLSFVIFGTPPMPMEDDRAKPNKIDRCG